MIFLLVTECYGWVASALAGLNAIAMQKKRLLKRSRLGGLVINLWMLID